MPSTRHTCGHCKISNTIYLRKLPFLYDDYSYTCGQCKGVNVFRPKKCIEGKAPVDAIFAEVVVKKIEPCFDTKLYPSASTP